MKTLKLLAVLLSYPSEELVAALPEIARRLGEETALRGATQDALAGLLAATPLAQGADMSKTLRVALPVAETGFDPQVTSDIYSSAIISA